MVDEKACKRVCVAWWLSEVVRRWMNFEVWVMGLGNLWVEGGFGISVGVGSFGERERGREREMGVLGWSEGERG